MRFLLLKPSAIVALTDVRDIFPIIVRTDSVLDAPVHGVGISGPP